MYGTVLAYIYFTDWFLCCPFPLPSLPNTIAGKTTPTTASTTSQVAVLPKVPGDSQKGTGPEGHPSVGNQGSPDSEAISVDGKEAGGAGRERERLRLSLAVCPLADLSR